jgi:predicted transcriptional regulator
MCTCDPCGCTDCRCGGASLGELEEQVLAIVWAAGTEDVTCRDVADELPHHAYTTVATILERLAAKGVVSQRKEAGRRRYAAVGSADARAGLLMRQALDGGRDAAGSLRAFARTLDAAERTALLAALAEG